MVTLVPFFKQINNVEDLTSKDLSPRLAGFDYMHCLELMQKSYFKFNDPSNHDFIIQTDLQTSLPNDLKTYRSDIDNEILMRAIPLSNKNFIDQAANGKYVLVGADHLVCGSVDLFFEDDFDIGLYVKSEYDPARRGTINNTVIAVNLTDNNRDRVKLFFKERLNQYDTLPPSHKLWWGDQSSILFLIERKGDHIKKYFQNGRKDKIIVVDQLTIRLWQYDRDHLNLHRPDKRFTKRPLDIIVDLKGEHKYEDSDFIDRLYNTIMAESF